MTTLLEVNDDGALVLQAEVLGDAPPHTRYEVEMRNGSLMLRPQRTEKTNPGPRKRRKPSGEDAWMREWNELGERVSQAWTGTESAAETVSQMRR